MRTVAIALVLFPLAACHSHHGGGVNPQVFTEEERNDDVFDANHFGVLFPGDHFFIDGFISDDGLDPFDGFAFTAGQPIHVDFQLFIDDPFDDLDVCLYDPQIDQTVACYATANNPERGGVDVLAGGLDFHLVVESFHGTSNYSLEIRVFPLAAAQAATSAPSLQRAAAPMIAGVDERLAAGRTPAAEHGYGKRLDAERPSRVILEQVIEVDPATGTVLEIVRVRP